MEKINPNKYNINENDTLSVPRSLFDNAELSLNEQKDQQIAKLEEELHKYFIDNENLAEQLRLCRENSLFKDKQLAEQNEI